MPVATATLVPSAMPASSHLPRRHSFQPDRILCEDKNYFLIVTFAVGAIFIASPVSGVTTTSSIATVAYAIEFPSSQ